VCVFGARTCSLFLYGLGVRSKLSGSEFIPHRNHFAQCNVVGLWKDVFVMLKCLGWRPYSTAALTLDGLEDYISVYKGGALACYISLSYSTDGRHQLKNARPSPLKIFFPAFY
jgi:hypothetical protein